MKHFVDRLFDVALYVLLVLFVANFIRGAISKYVLFLNLSVSSLTVRKQIESLKRSLRLAKQWA